MNRKQRRTRGKEIIERLSQLRNSKVLQALDMKDIPEAIRDSLIANTCDNLPLQKRYDLQKSLLQEAIELEVELDGIRADLASKTSKRG